LEQFLHVLFLSFCAQNAFQEDMKQLSRELDVCTYLL